MFRNQPVMKVSANFVVSNVKIVRFVLMYSNGKMDHGHDW